MRKAHQVSTRYMKSRFPLGEIRENVAQKNYRLLGFSMYRVLALSLVGPGNFIFH